MKRKILFLSIISLLLAGEASALTVLQLNLEQLTALAEKIFVGKCLSVKSETDEAGRPVQYITFEVSEMLKGEPAETITFKQIGYSLSEETNLEGITVQGVFQEVPRYEAGEEAVIFLSGESRLGFTAPVGLWQGKFLVKSADSGEKKVVNGMENRGLFVGWNKSPKFKSMAISSREKALLKVNGGQLPYSDFISLVKKLAAS